MVCSQITVYRICTIGIYTFKVILTYFKPFTDTYFLILIHRNLRLHERLSRYDVICRVIYSCKNFPAYGFFYMHFTNHWPIEKLNYSIMIKSNSTKFLFKT